MEPLAVRYVKTSDGYSIAYAVAGKGRPLVLTPPSLHDIQIVSRWPSYRPWLEGLSQRFRLVVFDARGQGMSTRGLPRSFTINDYETDLEAVLDALQLQRFILVGVERFGHVAVRYAVRYPERVEALILMTTSAAIKAWPLAHILGLGRENWDLLLWNNVSRSLTPAEAQTRLEEYRRIVNQSDGLTWWEACSHSDVSALLPEIRTPTLVIHPRSYMHLSPDEAVKLAAAIPNARLTLIDGEGPSNLLGDPGAALAAIDAFLASMSPRQKQPAAADLPSLSVRQLEVLRLIASGKTNREIAEALILSERTVERHVADVYAKLSFRNRAEAVGFAHDHLSGA